MYSDNRDLIISCVGTHLGIDNIIDANEVRTDQQVEFASKQGFYICTVHKKPKYFDVRVWKSIHRYRQKSRPVCDHRVLVDHFGQLYKKKRAGRKRGAYTKDMVSFSLEPKDLRMLDGISETRGRSNILRRSTQRHVYLEHLMWELKDETLHTRPVPNGWGLYNGNGCCIDTHEDEIQLLLNQFTYASLLTR
tara:strand:- start:45 stop:620 length:576 start_codon:yes stop_codon:yes gene_type:complete